MIKLIINADDFGSSAIFNEKIIDLLERDYVKSTTVLVDRVTEIQQGQISRLINLYQDKRISIGLHLDFDNSKPALNQIKSQYKKFVSIFGFEPTHLDVHKPRSEETLKIVIKFAENKNFLEPNKFNARNEMNNKARGLAKYLL